MTASLTRLGSIIVDLLADKEVVGLSEREMRRVCADLHQMTPRRYVRAHRDGDQRYRVAIVGSES